MSVGLLRVLDSKKLTDSLLEWFEELVIAVRRALFVGNGACLGGLVTNFSRFLAVMFMQFIWSVTAFAVPPNVPVTGPLPGLQNEEQVWFCPTNPSIIFTNHRDFRLGYRQIGMGRSVDGGSTWVDTLMAPAYQIYDWQSDPILTVTPSGRLVHCYLDFDPNVPDFSASYIAMLLSDDCGQTWIGPYTTITTDGPWFEDKQFITADRTSGPHSGNIYISWTRFSDVGGNFQPTRIMLVRSTFGGITWDDTMLVGAPFTTTCFGLIDAGQFSQPLVGADGAVYVFWQGYDIDSSSGCSWHSAIRMNKSIDGGQTWSNERVLNRVDGWSATSSGIDIYSQPVTDADISIGPHAGNLYLQYRDTLYSPGFDRGEILFRRSLDTGKTWSTPIVVNDDDPAGGAEQFHNWMVVNESGVLASIWYDTRLDPFKQKFDVFAAYSFDGGATWTANERISSVSSDAGSLLTAIEKERFQHAGAKSQSPLRTPASPMAGLIAEYIGLSIYQDKLVATWTDTRDGGQDVWSAAWTLHLTEPRLLTANAVALSCGDTLRWATAWDEDEDLYDIQITDDVTFATVDFPLASNTNRIALPSLGAGVWYWRVKSHIAPGGVPVESSAWSQAREFSIATSCIPCACDCHADPACDGIVSDVLDVVSTINVAFRGFAPMIDPNVACPFEMTDVNCSGSTDVVDVVRVVNVAFRGLSTATEYCDPCQ